MNFKTIKTDKYWLVVSDEIPEPKGQIIFEEISGLFSPYEKGDIVENPKTITGHLPINNSPKIEGVPLLMGEPEIHLINALATYDCIRNNIYPSQHKEESSWWVEAFINGYKAAQQKCGFSEEQLRKAVISTIVWCSCQKRDNSITDNLNEYSFSKEFENIIQSLQPQYEYVVEMEEKEYGHVDDYSKPHEFLKQPKTKIINNETYLVGTWKEVEK